jgi:hypothetical protein
MLPLPLRLAAAFDGWTAAPAPPRGGEEESKTFQQMADRRGFDERRAERRRNVSNISRRALLMSDFR